MAPRARRTANSRCRSAPRTSSRLPTLTQAINSTSPTTAVRSVVADLARCVESRDSGARAPLRRRSATGRFERRTVLGHQLRVDGVQFGRRLRRGGACRAAVPNSISSPVAVAILELRGQPRARPDRHPEVGSTSAQRRR